MVEIVAVADGVLECEMCTTGSRRASRQVLPTFGVPRERFFIAGEFVSSGRSHSVHGGVALRCCLDKVHQPISLAGRQTRDQRQQIVGSQRLRHVRHKTWSIR